MNLVVVKGSSVVISSSDENPSCIPLTNRVRGPYRKLRTEFFPPRQLKGKKRGSVTYSTDRENEVSKIFIISLVSI